MTREELYAESDSICKYLREHDADFYEINLTEDNIEISVSWGDWKHSHTHLDSLMKEMGYNKYDEELTEEDGSDCYSSIHYYKRT